MNHKRIIEPHDRRLCSLTGTALRLAAASVTTRTYATWNPADRHPNMELSSGNLTVTSAASTSAWRGVRATIGLSAGKWYWELTVGAGNENMVGVAGSAHSLSVLLGSELTGWSYYAKTGNKYNNNIATAYGTSVVAGTPVGVALNLDANPGEITFFNGGIIQGIAFSNLSGVVFPAFSLFTKLLSATANFGASAFVYAPPSGYNAGIYE